MNRGAMIRLACLCSLLIAGCASPFHTLPESTFRAGLPWVRPGVTTREETRLKLGIPGASFEDQRILAYGIVVTRDGSVAARFVEPDPQDPSLTPWGTYDSLVLVFDQAGVLRDFNIIRTER